MTKRKLEKIGIETSLLGFGCMRFPVTPEGKIDETEAEKMIDRAIAAGVNYIDTAYPYHGGDSEPFVGKVLNKYDRGSLYLATKLPVWLVESLEDVDRLFTEQLKRLQTDYIDLYYQHRMDPKVEPEIVAETMGKLMKEGKIRAWGISETSEEYLRRANAVTPVTAIENRYSMMARWHESIFPVCEELGITYVAFSPLANGILSGAYTSSTVFEGAQDYRANMPQYTKEGYTKASALLEEIRIMAQEKQCTMAQLSLAWMINRKPYIIPIPGSRKLERLASNFDAGKIFLSQQEVSHIDQLLDGLTFDVFGGHR